MVTHNYSWFQTHSKWISFLCVNFWHLPGTMFDTPFWNSFSGDVHDTSCKTHTKFCDDFTCWVLTRLKIVCGNHQSFLIILSTISRCKTRTSFFRCTTLKMMSNQTHQLQFLPTHQWPSHLQPCRSTQLHQHNFETSNNQFLMMMTSAIIIWWIFMMIRLSHKSRVRQASQSKSNKKFNSCKRR